MLPYQNIYQYFQQYTQIPEDEWRHFITLTHRKSLKKNEFLLKAQDPVKEIAFVMSGLMRVYYVDQEGNEYIKFFCPENALAAPHGELVRKIPSHTYVQALEDTEVLLVNYEDYTKLHNPCWIKLNLALVEKTLLMKEKREFDFLQLTAKERYQEFQKDHPELVTRLTQYQIASYLGITPVSLSRILTQD